MAVHMTSLLLLSWLVAAHPWPSRRAPTATATRCRLGPWHDWGTTRLRPGDCTLLNWAVSPDGRTLATGERRVVARSPHGEGDTVPPTPEAGFISLLRFSSDGRLLAVVGDRYGGLVSRPTFFEWYSVWVCDLRTGKTVRRIDEGEIREVGFLDGNSVLVTHAGGAFLADRDSQGEVVLWDVPSGKKLVTLPPALCCACSPDGKLLATGYADGDILLRQPRSGKVICRLRGRGGPIRELRFSPDFTLARLRRYGQKAANRPNLGEKTSGNPLCQLVGHKHPVSLLTFSPDSRACFTRDDYKGEWKEDGMSVGGWVLGPADGVGSGHRQALVYAARGCQRPLLSHLFPRQRKRVVWHQSGQLHEKPLEANKSATVRALGRGTLTGLTFAGQGRWLVGRAKGFHVWDRASGKELHQHEGPFRRRLQDSSIHPTAFPRSVQWGRAGTAGVWAVSTKRSRFCRGQGWSGAGPPVGSNQPGRTLVALDQEDTVRPLASRRPGLGASAGDNSEGGAAPERGMVRSSVPGFRTLAVHTESGEVQLWDTAAGPVRVTLKVPHYTDNLSTFSPDGCFFAARGKDHALRLWRTDSGKLLASLPGQEKDGAFVAFSPVRPLLAWGCGRPFTSGT